jgi:hypothetical protein
VAQLRGVIVGSMGANWDYRHFVHRPAWQAAARHWGFALVGTNNKKSVVLRKDPATTGADLIRAITIAADRSGHPELDNAAICSFGFSRGAAYSLTLATALPERVVAIVCGGSTPRAFDHEYTLRARTVPILLTQGSLDDLAGDGWFTSLPTVRAKGYRVALAGQWGLSHFEGNYENLALIHFDQAIRKRIPSDWDPGAEPVALKTIALDVGWLGLLAGCEKWETLQPEVHPFRGVAPAERAQHCWFPSEAMARVWQAYAPRQNAVMLKQPFCDSADYIASRALPDPHPANQPMALEAVSYWFEGATAVTFYAGSEPIAQGQLVKGESPQTWTAVWDRPTPGVHAIYAVFEQGERRCPTKPCPMVVVR